MSSEKSPWAGQFSGPLDVCKPSQVESYLSMPTALLNKDENIADARLPPLPSLVRNNFKPSCSAGSGQILSR